MRSRDGNVVSLTFNVCSLTPIHINSRLLCVCVWLSWCLVENRACSGAKGLCLPFLFYDIDPGDVPLLFISSLSFFCQGERGLDGFPGKHGDTGEQVGRQALAPGAGQDWGLCRARRTWGLWPLSHSAGGSRRVSDQPPAYGHTWTPPRQSGGIPENTPR